MRITIAILTLLLAAGGAFAQQDERFGSSPFTSQEAQEMSAVWPRIREAESFEQIDWESVGLEVAPGDAQARRLMAQHWDTLRRAESFSDIDWEESTDYRASSSSPFAQDDRASDSGPFTRREAEAISDAWPQIREAETFEEIDWEAAGLEVAPGSTEARTLMSRHWDTLRRAENFSDIDWEETTDYRASAASSRNSFADRNDAPEHGPFTSREAELMSAVWPEIREAETFPEINWDDLGLEVALGNAEARRLMARHWNTLRRAERFSDIDWQAATRFRDR